MSGLDMMLKSLSESEFDLVELLYKNGGAMPKRDWASGRKKGGAILYKPLPLMAAFYKYDPDYGSNGIPRIMLEKMVSSPGPWVYVAWSDSRWLRIKRWFEQRELHKQADNEVTLHE